MRIFVPLSALLLLAACNREAPDCGAQGADGCGRSVEETATAAVPEEAPSATATPAAPLDKSALNERKQPSRVLGYLAEAVNAGNWPDAALAWHTAEDGSSMTGPKLKELFGNPQQALLSFGPGDQEGAAGSSFYEAPILLIDTGSASHKQKEGTITLRRVNDVPGAEDWQLAWHVERLEWKN